ncbi:MAG TPA: 2OG-Fe(II) oxygenase [Thermoanaerobaculia bacterium]|nr:2OG-Fe(II) oxygenase [Thermoanaerobaculia bacterium]
MSRLTLANDFVRIYDDFLPRETFEPLLEYANSDSYSINPEESWNAARNGNAAALAGTIAYYRRDEALYQPWETLRYPTETALDAFIEALHDVDGAPMNWNCISIRPHIHPSGSSLSLHHDGRDYRYTGSGTFYIHREWNFHWGGHLLVFDPGKRDAGVALCVLPKPNRLVFLNHDVEHMVTRVDPRAGDRPRVALTALFGQ